MFSTAQKKENTFLIRDLIERVQHDPLFAAEGLDLSKACAALDRLEESLEVLISIWRKNIIARMFFLKHGAAIHPVQFLRLFLESEHKRRVFLLSPNEISARELVASWNKTAGAYIDGARAYRAALMELQRMEGIRGDFQVSYFDTAPTFVELLEWVSLLEKNGKELKHQITTSTPRPFLVGDVLAGNMETTLLSQELEELRTIGSLSKNAEECIGPISYKTGHFSGGEAKERIFFASIGRSREHHPYQIEIFLADDFYFLNFKKGHFLDMVIYRPLIEQGLSHWYQPSTTYYSSLDLRYHADIATIADMHRRGAQLNKELVVAQKSSLLDLLIGRGIHFNMRFAQLMAIFRHHGSMPPISFLLIARAYPSLYFLTFNKSVWRISEDAGLLASRFGSLSPYEHFGEVRKRISFSEISKIVEVSNRRMNFYTKEELGNIEY